MTDRPQKYQDGYDVTYPYDNRSQIQLQGLALAARRQLAMALSMQPSMPTLAAEDMKQMLVAVVAVLSLTVILGFVAIFALAFATLLILILFIGFVCIVVMDL